MRLVVYKDFLKTGRGADRAIAAFANAMVTYGHEVHILTQQRPTQPFSVTFDASITCHHVRKCRLKSLKGGINKFFLRTAWGERFLCKWLPRIDLMRETSLRLQEAIALIRPDVVVSAGSNECVELTYAGALGVPLVQMFHVYPMECFAKNKYQRVTRFKRALRHIAAAQVLLPSHRHLLREYTDAPVTTIGNAVAYPVDEPLPPREGRDKTIVYVAYFSKDKNHLALIDAFAQLDPTNGWELHLYGTGTPEWEKRIKDRIVEHGLGERVRLLGITHTPRSVLSHAGICAYPSMTEGFGLALVEAMWCGLPCVGFADAQGVNELIVDGANGLLASPSTPKVFAEQLKRLIKDEALREELGTYAARTVRATYTPERIWQQWNDLLLHVNAQKQLGVSSSL